MLRRAACSLAVGARAAPRLGLLTAAPAVGQLEAAASQANLWVQQCCGVSSTCWPSQQHQQHIQQSQICSRWQSALGLAGALQQAPLVAGQQWQQQRTLLGIRKHINYQDHNQKKPKKYKIKTPSIVKRRVIVGEDGTMWRMQAGRRHKRYKKGRLRLLDLKGMVPLHRSHAKKLKKLGFKRKWWHTLKA